jgi:hypothetical protein
VLISQYPNREPKWPGLTTCSRASDDTSNTARARGPLGAMAHEARYGPSKSPDRVRVSVSCNKVTNLPYL